MQTLNDVHQQFAEFFHVPDLKPYLYALSRKMSEGHICMDITQLETEDMPESYQAILKKKGNIEGDLVATTEQEYKPFVLHQGLLYLQRYFRYETQLLRNILDRIQSGRQVKEERMRLLSAQPALIRKLFSEDRATGTNWQLAAAITAIRNNFTIITGGPGTGKTTTVAKILALLFSLQPDIKVALAAPTGKAGARMAESLIQTKLNISETVRNRFSSLKPATIHRLLGWQRGTPYFRHHAGHPLPFDLVIVDESSMIDVALFAKLLDAVGQQSRIILLGDKDQLASVEAGSLFGDLCKAQSILNLFDPEQYDFINTFIDSGEQKIPESYKVEGNTHPLFQQLAELRYSHRFREDEGIGKLSRAVIRNDVPALEQFLEQNDSGQVYIDMAYEDAVFESFIAGYAAYLSEKDIFSALDKLNRLRVLCAVRQGEQGVQNMNAVIEAHFIRNRQIVKDHIFYEHRPVMVTKNNYTLGLYNGDVGILRKDEQGIMKAWFTDNTDTNSRQLKSVLPGFITHMETVFAMTIHKSQGSEFDQVMVVLPKNAGQQLLTRELLYTGITRARGNVIVRATPETFLATAQGMVERGSGVMQRLAAEARIRESGSQQ